MESVPVGKREASPDPTPLDGGPERGGDDLIEDFLAHEKRFDASQYAFFGRDVANEVEIGGLDEEDYVEQDDDGLEEEGLEDSLGGEKGAGSGNYDCDLGEVSEVAIPSRQSDASSSEVDKALSGHLEAALKLNDGKGATAFRQSFEPVPSNWLDHKKQERPVEQGGKSWWPPESEQELASEAEFGGVLGPPSLPNQQYQWQHGGEPSSMQAALPTVHLPSTQQSQQLLPYIAPSAQLSGKGSSLPPPGQYGQPYFPIQSPYGVPFASQYSSSGSIMPPLVPPAQWVAHNNVQHGSVSGLGPQQLPMHSPLLPTQVVLHYQLPHVQQLHGVVPPYAHLKPQHKFHAASLAPQILPRMGEGLVGGELRDLFPPRGRQTLRHHQHGLADGQMPFRNGQNSGWQPLRSKYMTAEEIENIVRIQWAATHSSDPYVDDYYHQAMQTKISRGSPHGRRHFAPSHLRDLPSHTRATVEPHAFLQVDALGRVPFSSIRRPRPLLEVDSGLDSGGLLIRGQGDASVDGVPQYRPLDQEPMLAARIAIEDGLCLLLDVDDIDRLLTNSQPPDGGAQLRRRRQLLVEGLAVSLHLVGTNGDDAGVSNACFTGLPSKDDVLFLRLLSLSKGRKLLGRYLQLLTPGSELIRIVAVAIFRHLRFLFGGVQSDSILSDATFGLANATAASVGSLDLSGLSACLAAVLLAPEQPPLRPMGSPSGDGATVVLRALLDRATGLLTDRNTAFPLQNRAVWQASFDAFFALLAKYCTNKYDSIFHSLMMTSSSNPAAVNATAAAAMSKEMPVELLRASLPHTNDHQRNLLLAFTQRSMSMGSLALNANAESHAATFSART